MEQRALWRIVFIAIFSVLTAARLYYRVRAGAFRERLYADRLEWRFIALRGVFGIPLVAATIAFVLGRPSLAWSYVGLPGWVHWAGAGIALCAVGLIISAHHALGVNFSPTIRLHRDHHLVTAGPYRIIRHPMYAAYLLLFVGAFLLSGSWVIGLSGTAVILTLMTVRLLREERAMEERFGSAWRDYRDATGAFLPRLARGRQRLRRVAAG